MRIDPIAQLFETQQPNVLKIGPRLFDANLAAMKKVLSTFVDPAFTSISTLTQQTKTVSVLGAQVGDAVILGPPNNLGSTGLFVVHKYVSAADTVTIVIHNSTGGSLTPTAGSWRVVVIGF